MANETLHRQDMDGRRDARAKTGPLKSAIEDVTEALRRYRLAMLLGWQDVKQRYRRSTLGPFWLTISMGVMIGVLALVFGQIFKAPMSEFLPFLAAGLILWGFIAGMLTEGCTCFINADHVIKELPIPLFTHLLRVYWRGAVILAHNLLIFPLVLLAVAKPVPMTAIVGVAGFALLSLNLVWMGLFAGVLCTRYRDLPPIISSVVQIGFYLTPIIWLPELVPERAALYLLDLNPLYHLMNIVRAPLLGQLPTLLNWVACAGLAIVGWTATLLFYGRYRRRIAYWL